MMRFKGCPKCNGDVLLDRDHYGWYEQCLQCGYLRDLRSIVEIQQQWGQEKKKLSRLRNVG